MPTLLMVISVKGETFSLKRPYGEQSSTARQGPQPNSRPIQHQRSRLGANRFGLLPRIRGAAPFFSVVLPKWGVPSPLQKSYADPF